MVCGGDDGRGGLWGIGAGVALWVVVIEGAAGRGKVWRAGPFVPVDWIGGFGAGG